MFDPHEEFDPFEESESGSSEVLFQSSYGDAPKRFLYRGVPFLLLASGVLWFKNWIIMPSLILLLCGLHLVMHIYRRFNPQRIVITTDGLLLPKGRFTTEEVHIRWDDLTATLFASTLVCEVTCVDCQRGTKVRIASTLFQNFDDFASFAIIVGKHAGEDWCLHDPAPRILRP